jgi:hypothetical protein
MNFFRILIFVNNILNIWYARKLFVIVNLTCINFWFEHGKIQDKPFDECCIFFNIIKVFKKMNINVMINFFTW